MCVNVGIGEAGIMETKSKPFAMIISKRLYLQVCPTNENETNRVQYPLAKFNTSISEKGISTIFRRLSHKTKDFSRLKNASRSVLPMYNLQSWIINDS